MWARGTYIAIYSSYIASYLRALFDDKPRGDPEDPCATHARPAHVAPCGPAASLASVMVLNHQSINTVLPGVKHMHVVKTVAAAAATPSPSIPAFPAKGQHLRIRSARPRCARGERRAYWSCTSTPWPRRRAGAARRASWRRRITTAANHLLEALVW